MELLRTEIEGKFCYLGLLNSPKSRQLILTSDIYKGVHLGIDKPDNRLCLDSIGKLSTLMSQGMLNSMSKRHCPVDLRTNLHSIPVTGLWKQVGVDLIGPLPVTAAKRLYIITLSDFYSKWPETKAVPDKIAASTSNLITDVMMRFGCTDILISDYQWREYV